MIDGVFKDRGFPILAEDHLVGSFSGSKSGDFGALGDMLGGFMFCGFHDIGFNFESQLDLMVIEGQGFNFQG
jgi:hypothetical protein